METAQKTTIQEKREILKDFSSKAKAIKEELLKNCTTPEQEQQIESATINSIIVEHIYTDETHKKFNTFKGWIKEGFCVRKGQKAFLLWGRKKQEVEKPNGEQKTEELDFFPITFVFSNHQVRPLQDAKD